MAFTYDLSTDVGKCRLMFPDRDSADPLFQDEEWSAFLTIEGDIRRARARALETAAADLTLTLRVTRTLGLEVDGAKASAELRLLAKAEREQAADVEAESGGLWDWAEWGVDDFSARERLDAELLRAG